MVYEWLVEYVVVTVVGLPVLVVTTVGVPGVVVTRHGPPVAKFVCGALTPTVVAAAAAAEIGK